MIDVESIRKAALYYINNDVTLEDAALYVGIKSKKEETEERGKEEENREKTKKKKKKGKQRKERNGKKRPRESAKEEMKARKIK